MSEHEYNGLHTHDCGLTPNHAGSCTPTREPEPLPRCAKCECTLPCPNGCEPEPVKQEPEPCGKCGARAHRYGYGPRWKYENTGCPEHGDNGFIWRAPTEPSREPTGETGEVGQGERERDMAAITDALLDMRDDANDSAEEYEGEPRAFRLGRADAITDVLNLLADSRYAAPEGESVEALRADLQSLLNIARSFDGDYWKGRYVSAALSLEAFDRYLSTRNAKPARTE